LHQSSYQKSGYLDQQSTNITIIKASPSDFGSQDNTNIIVFHIPDFLTISPRPQEVATILADQNLRNKKLCSISPVGENRKSFGTPATISPPTNINDDDPTTSQETIKNHKESSLPDKLLTSNNDVSYTHQSIRNLKFQIQPI